MKKETKKRIRIALIILAVILIAISIVVYKDIAEAVDTINYYGF